MNAWLRRLGFAAVSVIGATGTGTARERLSQLGSAAARQLIGQFGIGILSAFLVAERVVVRTRKAGSSEALAWENTGTTGGYNITALSGQTHTLTPTTSLPGITGAYSFDGTGSSGGGMTTLDGLPSNRTTSFELWFRPTDLTGSEPLFETGGSGSGMSLAVRNDQLLFTIKDGGTNGSAAFDLVVGI